MNKLKRVLAAALALCTLSGCVSSRPEADIPESGETVKVAYVPIDDRPDNVERVEYLAQSLGYELLMPDKDLYSTKLNGQPKNANGTGSGDRAALYEWVLEQEKSGCDRFILCTDQLLSGGLVNSRAMTQSEPVTLRDGSSMTEYELLESLIGALSADGNNRVWLLDTVMRLAPTVGYLHWDSADYENLRSYAIEARPEIVSDSLTVENIVSSYRLNASGDTISPETYGLEEQDISEYLAARERKLELSSRMMSILPAESGTFRVLFGIDDSSDEFCIQKNEIAYLRTILRECDALLSGVDDLAFKAVSRMYLDDVSWSGSDVSVSYYGGTEDEPACIYDYHSLDTVMAEHLRFFDLFETEDAKLQVLVLTQPADESKTEEYFDALFSKLTENRKAGRPTVLIDASDSRYGTAFQERLVSDAELGWLIAYSGALDMAIVSGTALSHGVARYARLQNAGATKETEKAFLCTLTDSIVKDICYRGRARGEVSEYLVGTLGGKGDNMYEPEVDVSAVTQYMAERMEKLTAPVLKNLKNSSFIYSLEEYAELHWGSVELSDYSFPWSRVFEIAMRIKMGNPTE